MMQRAYISSQLYALTKDDLKKVNEDCESEKLATELKVKIVVSGKMFIMRVGSLNTSRA